MKDEWTGSHKVKSSQSADDERKAFSQREVFIIWSGGFVSLSLSFLSLPPKTHLPVFAIVVNIHLKLQHLAASAASVALSVFAALAMISGLFAII